MKELVASPAFVFLCVALGVTLLIGVAAFVYVLVTGAREYRQAKARFDAKQERIEADIEATRARIGFNPTMGHRPTGRITAESKPPRGGSGVRRDRM